MTEPGSGSCGLEGGLQGVERRLPTTVAARRLDGNTAELPAGYATASNGGHRDPTRGAARFLDNPTLIDDYAHARLRRRFASRRQ
jgi:hypothetical protein